MVLLQTFLAFMLAIGLLVVVHELGHYLVARWCGVKVLRFSLGMGRVLYSRRFGRDQTEWAISLLPLGGYVKLLDAREDDLSELPPEDLKREFNSQNVWKRIAIVAAGPIANFLLAIAVLAGLYMHGVPGATTKLRQIPQDTVAWQAGLRGGDVIAAVNGEKIAIWSDFNWSLVQAAVDRTPVSIEVIRQDSSAATGEKRHTFLIPAEVLSAGELERDFLRRLGLTASRPPALLRKVLPDGAAYRAGLREGDRILAVDGRPLIDGLDLVETVRAAPGKTMTIKLRRDAQEIEMRMTPDAETIKGVMVGKIMAEVALRPDIVVARDPPTIALAKALRKTWETTVISLKMFGKMIIGEVSLKNISGPITIADYAGQTARVGAVSYLSFIAFISISLGIMNLLPIPVLDGGLLLYYSYEVLTGRPISERAGRIAQRVGLAMLATLMVVAVFNDIVRLIF